MPRSYKNTAEAGYGLIEIPALDPKSIDIDHTKATLKEFGLKGACSLGLSFDADINNENPDIVKKVRLDLLMHLMLLKILVEIT